MAPIEIRPITSDRNGDNRPARPAAAPVPGPLPASAGPARAAIPVFTYDANQDGPWPRSDEELTAAIKELFVTAIGLDLRERLPDPQSPLTVPEAYVHGVWVAAHWTLAARPDAPISREVTPVTDASVKGQARLADGLRQRAEDAGEDVAAAYAYGVLAWLSWLVGAWDSVWS